MAKAKDAAKVTTLQELADNIKSIPQADRPMAITCINCYLSGFIAGQNSAKQGA